MTANEAAERLRDKMIEFAPSPLVRDYEQAVRRATVERIRARWNGTNGRMRLDAILDEETAR